jgi:hypothetical protein
MALCILNILLLKANENMEILAKCSAVPYIELQRNFSTSLDADSRSPDRQADGQI